MCAHTSTHTRTYTCVHWYIHTCRNTQREKLSSSAVQHYVMCPYASPPQTQVHDYSGWGGLLCGGCVQVHNKDMIVLEPRPHHTLLASFGEDTAETVGTLFAVIQVVLVRCCHHSHGFRVRLGHLSPINSPLNCMPCCHQTHHPPQRYELGAGINHSFNQEG